jgi:foldase protein PrsA
MKKRTMLSLFAGLLVTAWLSAGWLSAEVVDWTLVTIDEETVTYSELAKTIKEMRDSAGKFGDLGINLNSPAEILDRLLSNRVLTLEAKKNAIDVSDSEINDRKEMFKKMNNLSEDLFRQVLKQQNITMKELEDNYREQIRNEKLQQMEIRNKIKPPSDDEMKKFYNENKDKMLSPLKVHVLSILIKDRPEGTLQDRVKMQKTLETIITKAKQGGDFSKIARDYSEDEATKDKGGDLGWVSQGTMAPEFEQMAFKLAVGEVSTPFQTRWGFNIIKVIDKKKPTAMPYEDAKPNIKNALVQKALHDEFINWIAEKKKTYGIKAIFRDGQAWTYGNGIWTSDTGKKTMSAADFMKFFDEQYKNGKI